MLCWNQPLPFCNASRCICCGLALDSLYHREEDIQKMLAAQVHIGTRNSDSHMQDYIWRRRQV